MTHDEYEQSKLRLEEQRRSGVELVEAAYQAQIRALSIWSGCFRAAWDRWLLSRELQSPRRLLR